jgi:chorismate mutase
VDRRSPAYICGGYVASGRDVCDGLRVPVSYLDNSVLEGIQKRLGQVLDHDALRQRVRGLLEADMPTDDVVPVLESRLTDTKAKIDRLVTVLTGGAEDLPSVRRALVDLERERHGLEQELARARMASGPRRVDDVVDQMLEAVGRFGEVLDAGQPEEQKAVVRAFLREIRIEKTPKRAVLQWYRLPVVDRSLGMVELRGFEPLTPRLPALCSPN